MTFHRLAILFSDSGQSAKRRRRDTYSRRNAQQPVPPERQRRRCACRCRPVNWGVRRLVAVLAVGGFPECKPSWLVPSWQMRGKALSLPAGYAPREQAGSSKPDSPAPAETSARATRSRAAHHRWLELTRAAVVNIGGTPAWSTPLSEARWYANGVQGGSAEHLLSIEVRASRQR